MTGRTSHAGLGVAKNRSIMSWPDNVRMDSGWNWTPELSRLRCRTPITMPDGVRAVTTRSVAVKEASSTVKEW